MEHLSDPLAKRVACPVWHSRLLDVVYGGLSCKCKSCRGTLHFISKEEILLKWEEIERLHQASQQQGVA